MKLQKPTSEQVKAARTLANQTQEEAALSVHLANYKTWQTYELGERSMSVSTWELYLIKNFVLKKETSTHKMLSSILKIIG